MAVRQDFNIEIGTTPRAVATTVTYKSTGDPFPLTGCNVSALLKDRKGNVILALAPVISDELGGIITISITDEQTAVLSPADYLKYDLILELSTGVILPPIVSGEVSIYNTVTLS